MPSNRKILMRFLFFVVRSERGEEERVARLFYG